MPGKAWKLKKGRFGYITARGKRGIESTLAAARAKAGLGKSKSKSKSKSNPGNTRRKAREVTIPIAIVGPIAGTLMWSHLNHPKLEGKFNLFIKAYTGFDPGLGTYHSGWLRRGLYPLILGALIHKFVGGAPLNVNRALGRAKIPFLRL